MNKLFIVLLAVCLVSVNAFVKRAPETTTEQNHLEKLKQRVAAFSTQITSEMSKTFDPEALRKDLKDFENDIKNLANKLTEARAKAA